MQPGICSVVGVKGGGHGAQDELTSGGDAEPRPLPLEQPVSLQPGEVVLLGVEVAERSGKSSAERVQVYPEVAEQLSNQRTPGAVLGARAVTANCGEVAVLERVAQSCTSRAFCR